MPGTLLLKLPGRLSAGSRPAPYAAAHRNARFVRVAPCVLLATCLLAIGTSASAETYRWKDPRTGRMVISDQPPPAGIAPARRSGAPVAADVGSGGGTPPYAVREAMRNFPVRLYTAPQCKTECQEARQLLQGRGIPYREESVATRAALEDLRRLAGQDAVPVLQVGQEVIVGMSLPRWNQTLDLAGYPKTAYAGYRPPPPPVEALMPPPEDLSAPPGAGNGETAPAPAEEPAQ